MGSNKRKYLRNNSSRLLISCSTVYITLSTIVLGTIQKETDANIKNKIKKINDMNVGVFRIEWSIYDRAFLRKSLTDKIC